MPMEYYIHQYDGITLYLSKNEIPKPEVLNPEMIDYVADKEHVREVKKETIYGHKANLNAVHRVECKSFGPIVTKADMSVFNLDIGINEKLYYKDVYELPEKYKAFYKCKLSNIFEYNLPLSKKKHMCNKFLKPMLHQKLFIEMIYRYAELDYVEVFFKSKSVNVQINGFLKEEKDKQNYGNPSYGLYPSRKPKCGEVAGGIQTQSYNPETNCYENLQFPRALGSQHWNIYPGTFDSFVPIGNTAPVGQAQFNPAVFSSGGSAFQPLPLKDSSFTYHPPPSYTSSGASHHRFNQRTTSIPCIPSNMTQHPKSSNRSPLSWNTTLSGTLNSSNSNPSNQTNQKDYSTPLHVHNPNVFYPHVMTRTNPDINLLIPVQDSKPVSDREREEADLKGQIMAYELQLKELKEKLKVSDIYEVCGLVNRMSIIASSRTVNANFSPDSTLHRCLQYLQREQDFYNTADDLLNMYKDIQSHINGDQKENLVNYNDILESFNPNAIITQIEPLMAELCNECSSLLKDYTSNCENNHPLQIEKINEFLLWKKEYLESQEESNKCLRAISAAFVSYGKLMENVISGVTIEPINKELQAKLSNAIEQEHTHLKNCLLDCTIFAVHDELQMRLDRAQQILKQSIILNEGMPPAAFETLESHLTLLKYIKQSHTTSSKLKKMVVTDLVRCLKSLHMQNKYFLYLHPQNIIMLDGASLCSQDCVSVYEPIPPWQFLAPEVTLALKMHTIGPYSRSAAGLSTVAPVLDSSSTKDAKTDVLCTTYSITEQLSSLSLDIGTASDCYSLGQVILWLACLRTTVDFMEVIMNSMNNVPMVAALCSKDPTRRPTILELELELQHVMAALYDHTPAEEFAMEPTGEVKQGEFNNRIVVEEYIPLTIWQQNSKEISDAIVVNNVDISETNKYQQSNFENVEDESKTEGPKIDMEMYLSYIESSTKAEPGNEKDLLGQMQDTDDQSNVGSISSDEKKDKN